jgi:hypothetical protein
MENQVWLEARKQTPEKMALARKVLEEIRDGRKVLDAVRHYPLSDGGYLGKNLLVAAYRQLTESGEWSPDPGLLERIRMKPVRTCDHGHSVDQTVSLPRKMYFLSY